MRLREIRKARGWTQTELASRAGFKPSAIGHWEIGRRTPSWPNAIRLAAALGTSLDALAGRPETEDVDMICRRRIAALIDA